MDDPEHAGDPGRPGPTRDLKTDAILTQMYSLHEHQETLAEEKRKYLSYRQGYKRESAFESANC